MIGMLAFDGVAAAVTGAIACGNAEKINLNFFAILENNRKFVV